MQTLHESWLDKTGECMQEYTNIINNMAAQIYSKLKHCHSINLKSNFH